MFDEERSGRPFEATTDLKLIEKFHDTAINDLTVKMPEISETAGISRE